MKESLKIKKALVLTELMVFFMPKLRPKKYKEPERRVESKPIIRKNFSLANEKAVERRPSSHLPFISICTAEGLINKKYPDAFGTKFRGLHGDFKKIGVTVNKNGEETHWYVDRRKKDHKYQEKMEK